MKRKLFLLLCALLTMIGVQAQTAPKAGAIPASGEEYYLYNIASGRYMSRGSSYTTHVTVDGCGEVITVGGSEGSYTLHMASVSDANAFVSNDGWIDGADARKGEFSFVSANKDGYSNVYQLQLKDAATGYYWAGGSGAWGNECIIGELSSNTDASLWLFIPKSTRQTISAVGDDATVAVANPDFERFTDFGGWTRVGSGQDNDGNWNQSNGAQGTSARFMERWTGTWNTTSGDGSKLYDASLKQTVTLPVGKYRLSANVWAVNQAAASEKVTGVTLYAGTAQKSISQEASEEAVTLDFVASGSVEIGLKIESTNANWVGLDNIRLTYLGEDISDYVTAYHEARDAANAVDQSAPMLGTALTALQTAISTYGSGVDEESKSALQEATGALGTATSDATNSIAAYANAKAYLDEAATILAGTNVYTAEAYADKYTTPLAKYEARTLTNEEGNAFVKTSTGWHSNNTIDEILLSAWTIGGNQCHKFDTPLYINTWSTEGATDGSEFLAPFFEYWVGDGDVLGANTIVATVAGLNPNATYSFTIRARVRQTNNKTKIANGVTMKVGAGEAVDISAGAKFGTTSFYIGNFSAVGETDADGKLTMTMTVAENSNISWLSFYNAKWTEGEDLSAYIADYEFAKSTAIANRDNAAYAAVTGKERVDLVNTITTYSAVDVTSKAALIEAKEALEAASNTFVTAAPAYIGIAELNPNVAATLGVALPTITSETVAADLDVNGIIVAEYTAGKAYAQDFTNKLGDWTNAPGNNKGESWKDGNDEYYDLYNAADRAMTQTVTLPKGDYALIAKARASVNGRLTLVVGDETVTYAHKGSVGRGIATNGDATFADDATYTNNNNGRGWEYRVMTFTSDGETPVTLTFNWKTASNNWCGLDDIVLLCNPAALDYSALQTAYDAVVVPTLGFEAGEYAPYNNKENLENIAAAKSMLDNQNADNQDAIDNATAAITGMTWTANTEELNAIYGGDFTKYETINGQDMPYGWNLYNAGNNSRIMGGTEGTSNAGLAAASSGKALLMKFNATYGESEGYTMPLKGGKVYQIQFIYGGWNNQPNTVVSLTDPNGETITLSPNFKPATNDAYSNAEHWYQYTGYFAATADGNYKLHFNKVESGQQQIILGDIDLRQAASQTLTITDGEALPKFAPGTYPSATYSRSLTPGNKWGTICVPFNLKSDENIQFYNVSSIGYGVLNVETVTEVAAGVPAIFKKLAPEATISVTTNEATVVSAPAEAESGTNAKLVGTFTGITIDGESVGNYYYVKTDQFWRGNGNFTIPAYRAYVEDLTATHPGARLVINVDGEDPTAINVIEAAEAEEGTLKDGKYLINGKVVLVKNGVKYGANGQKLN